MFDMPIKKKKHGIQSLLFTVITCAYFNVATIQFVYNEVQCVYVYRFKDMLWSIVIKVP